MIAVIGARECDPATARVAEEVGRRIAEAGFALVCGGLGGVMEAACRGAAAAGGLTVGVLPGESPASANRHVAVRLATGMGIARNVIIVRSAGAAIAVSGGAGTLSEMAYCLQLGVPVVSLGSWEVSDEVHRARTAEEAVAMAARLALAGE
jgi:uncharacterized protein (TIGR00725 family)